MALNIRTQSEREPVASVRSDDDGFYEVELAAGDHVICTSFERCTDFRVEPEQTVRLDYAMSVGPGWKK
ncbi:carboxypeptidase regulatory-like domain-containing protein [Myxococcus sp. K38C18041901]|uniref:carboxypeptidase regulatory-like domain-containing protein n=1 Tax=Myxococcus guangdongensis TaxID=2906760 RepID=UPI0020A748E2|nr:carboxypeptidase regulatory-like domain-containing protein [Myxococcus guangdongensis]MCP3064958.1 carboxypeptidase regulatory-like domain-containing protein [Myxococcus guangdongensis]